MCVLCIALKALLRTNVLNDVTAAPFLVVFLQLAAEKKTTENSAARTSLRTFVRSNDFNRVFSHKKFQNLLVCFQVLSLNIFGFDQELEEG